MEVADETKPPKQDHHFIPCFYSKRWAGPELLCEFSRPYDIVKPRRTSPKGTGYVPRLYAIDDEQVHRQNRLEDEFYKPVDTRAADALGLIENDIRNADWPPALRRAWSSFVMSLLLRMPQDMALVEASYRREFAYLTADQRRQYAAKRKSGWPATLSDAVGGLNDQAAAGQGKELITRLVTNPRIAGKIEAMHWRALDVSAAREKVLTSDRRVHLNGKLGDVKTTIILPIGPGRLFVAAASEKRVDEIAAKGADRLVARSNQIVTRSAEAYVYGQDDSALDFVRHNFGRDRKKSVLRDLVDHIELKRGPTSSIRGGHMRRS